MPTDTAVSGSSVLTGRARGWPAGYAILFAATGLLLALGHALGRPFISNQNHYLVPAMAERIPRLREDWFASTPDPYPFFSWIAGVSFDLAGPDGLRIVAFASALIGIWGIGLISAAINPTQHASVPIVVMIVVGGLLNPHMDGVFKTALAALYPIPLVGDVAEWLAVPIANPFHGLAGQYSVSTIGYLQPSSAGVLLLPALAFYLWGLRLRDSHTQRSMWLFIAASALTALASAVHPTYMVTAMMGLGVAGLLDAYRTRKWRRLSWYIGVAAVVLVCALAANPALVGVASSAADDSEALHRFAFENIPFHTLWFEWPTHDVMRILVIMAGALMAVKTRSGSFLGLWLISTLGIGLVSAAIVAQTYWTTLALLFPWRISVVLLPVAWTVLVTVGVAYVRERLPQRVAPGWTWVCVALALIGLSAIALRVQVENAQRLSPRDYDAATRAVIQASPPGVGFTPLGSTHVRLNAAVPVYVESNSPPYAGQSLIEWWRRIDNSASISRDPEAFCVSGVSDEVDWVLWNTAWELPTCVSSWRQASEVEDFFVLIRE